MSDAGDPMIARGADEPTSREPMLPANAGALMLVEKIRIGMTRDEVVGALGPPDDVGGTSRRYRTPSIYRYGDIQLFFAPWKNGQLLMVWREGADGEGEVLLGERGT